MTKRELATFFAPIYRKFELVLYIGIQGVATEMFQRG